jgi:serine/threonine protein phosphatase PrpC
MEDAFLIQGNFQGNEIITILFTSVGDPDMDLYGVFDGHAGAAAAKFSAKNYPTAFQTHLKEDKDPVIAIRKAFSTVNEDFRKHLENDPAAKNTGSTALVVLLTKEKILLGNLGDTRAVLCRKGKAIRISVDHKPLDEEDRINALGGWVMNDATRRINGLLAVSRSIGDYFMEPFVCTEPCILLITFPHFY